MYTYISQSHNKLFRKLIHLIHPAFARSFEIPFLIFTNHSLTIFIVGDTLILFLITELHQIRLDAIILLDITRLKENDPEMN